MREGNDYTALSGELPIRSHKRNGVNNFCRTYLIFFFVV